jgi:Flp pilus assembly pilin Flp
MKFKTGFKEKVKRILFQAGASSAEYAILIALIAAVIVLVLIVLGLQVKELFDIPPF